MHEKEINRHPLRHALKPRRSPASSKSLIERELPRTSKSAMLYSFTGYGKSGANIASILRLPFAGRERERKEDVCLNKVASFALCVTRQSIDRKRLSSVFDKDEFNTTRRSRRADI